MNLKAAKMLIDNDLYAPSVHCSYYGAYQYAVSSLINYLSSTAEDLSAEIRYSSKGSHVYVLDEVSSLVGHNSDNYNKRNFKNKFKDLKFFRTKSDYHNKIVSKKLSIIALKHSEFIISKLKENL